MERLNKREFYCLQWTMAMCKQGPSRREISSLLNLLLVASFGWWRDIKRTQTQVAWCQAPAQVIKKWTAWANRHSQEVSSCCAFALTVGMARRVQAVQPRPQSRPRIHHRDYWSWALHLLATPTDTTTPNLDKCLENEGEDVMVGWLMEGELLEL